MKVRYAYSHFGGSEVLQVGHPDRQREVHEVINSITLGAGSADKGGARSAITAYSVNVLTAQFRRAFASRGYGEMRDSYSVSPPVSRAVVASESRQIGSTKGSVVVQVQFGNYPSMFLDLANFEYFYSERKCEVAVEIVPCYRLAKNMIPPASYGEKLVFDMERMRDHFPTVPINVVLVDLDDEC